MLGCVAMTPRRKARVPLVVLLLAFVCPGAAYLANAEDHEEDIEPSEEPQEIKLANPTTSSSLYDVCERPFSVVLRRSRCWRD